MVHPRSLAAITILVLLGGNGARLQAQSGQIAPGPVEVDINGLLVGSVAYVHPLRTSPYSVGVRGGLAWEWGGYGPFSLTSKTFEHDVFNVLSLDAVVRRQIEAGPGTFAQFEAGPTFLRYDWGDDGAGSGAFVGLHVGGGLGWGRVSTGMSARLGRAVNDGRRSSTGVFWGPYLRIAF